ncbi:MAG: 30S ribosomal protein S6 [Candidatus Caldatribacteriaceae bacterium]
MNRYELGIVVKPNLSEAELSTVIEKLKLLIGEQGGTVEEVNLWGKRRLAYPVDKQSEGYYAFFRFLLPPTKTHEISRVVGLTEEILRYILVKEKAKKDLLGKGISA